MGGGGGAPGAEGGLYGLLTGVEVIGLLSDIWEGGVNVKFGDELAS